MITEGTTPADTKEDREALFAAAFNGMKPMERRVLVAEKIGRFREQILERRKAGYSWKQIALALRHPAIGIKTTAGTLRDVLGKKRKSAAPAAAGVQGTKEESLYG